MIFKEENILTPMLLETLTEEEWAEIKQEDEEFGVVFSKPHGNFWQPKAVTTKNISFEPTGEALSSGYRLSDFGTNQHHHYQHTPRYYLLC